MAAGPVSASAMARRRMWVLLGAVGSLLVVALVVSLIVWRGGAGTPDATETAGRPQPHSSPAPLAVTAAPAPAPDGPRPSTCDQLYSPEMVTAFGDMVLNPAWAEADDSEVRYGSDDTELISVIGASTGTLTCVWGNETGGSDSGLTTNVVFVTPEQNANVQARLVAQGLNCYEELGGMRCLVETSGEGGVTGESHFLRDGIWLATRYVNAGPDGYTHDIIANVWAGA